MDKGLTTKKKQQHVPTT